MSYRPMKKTRKIDRGECFYCGSLMKRGGSKDHKPTKYSRDHLLSKKLAAPGLPRATVGACVKCNNVKGDEDPVIFIQQRLMEDRQMAINWNLIFAEQKRHGRTAIVLRNSA